MNEHIREIMDEETFNHINEEMPRVMEELMEFNEMAFKLTGKLHRRTQKVIKHMQTCGTCLNRQMKLGLLMPIEDFYAQGQAMGVGRLPKLHHMMN